MKRNKSTNPVIKVAGIALTVIVTLVTSSIGHAAVANINDLDAAKGSAKLYKRMSDKERKAMRGGQTPDPSLLAPIGKSESAPADNVTRHTDTADSSSRSDEQEQENKRLKDLEDQKRKDQEKEDQRLKDLEDQKRKNQEKEDQRLKDLEDQKRKNQEKEDQRLKDLEDQKRKNQEKDDQRLKDLEDQKRKDQEKEDQRLKDLEDQKRKDQEKEDQRLKDLEDQKRKDQEKEDQRLKDLEDQKRKDQEKEDQRLKDLEDQKRKDQEKEDQRLKDLEDQKRKEQEESDDDDTVVTNGEVPVDEFVISDSLLDQIRHHFEAGRQGVLVMGRSDDYLAELAGAFRTIYNHLEDKGAVSRQDGNQISAAFSGFVPYEKRNGQGEIVPSDFVSYPMVRGVLAENTGVAALSMMVKVETYQRPKGAWVSRLTSCTPEALQITMVNNSASASGWATYVDPMGSNTEKVKECLNVPNTVFMGEGEKVQAIGAHNPYMIEAIILMVMTGEAQSDYYRMILARASEQDDETETAELMQKLMKEPAASRTGKQITEADFFLVR